MQTIEALASESELTGLCTIETTEGPTYPNDDLARIQGLHAAFKRLDRTPSLLRIMLQKEFNFEGQVSAFATTNPSEIERLLHPETDWYNSVFVLPQFGRMQAWMKKAVQEADKGKTVVVLVPARTNTDWFHELCLARASEIRFVRGRLTLPGYTNQSPFPDCVCVYRGRKANRNDDETTQDDDLTVQEAAPSLVPRYEPPAVSILTGFASDVTTVRPLMVQESEDPPIETPTQFPPPRQRRGPSRRAKAKRR